MAIKQPLINSTASLPDYSWIQKGYTYGINDSGPWQRLERRGLMFAIEAWYTILTDAGWIVSVTREAADDVTGNGIGKLEATAGWPFPALYGTETPENIWELDPQDVQKDLLESDYPNGTVNLTSNLSRAAVTNMLQDSTVFWAFAMSAQNPTDYAIVRGSNTIWAFDDGLLTIAGTVDITLSGPNTTVPPGLTAVVHLPSADAASAYSLYLLEKSGVTDFPIEASVIRHSLVTSNLYAVQANYNNMLRIISSSSMTSIENVPGTLLFAVPTTPTPSQFVQSPGDLQYGWRKVRPAVTRLNRMKWRVQQNYQLGLWPVVLFGNTI